MNGPMSSACRDRICAGCTGYTDGYETYTCSHACHPLFAIHELVFTDRQARPAKWQTRCGRTDIPLEQAMSPTPHSYYEITCSACRREQR
jgi:hypothetical protein